jgi:uncharacterized protein YpuA (DUF1002 family)
MSSYSGEGERGYLETNNLSYENLEVVQELADKRNEREQKRAIYREQLLISVAEEIPTHNDGSVNVEAIVANLAKSYDITFHNIAQEQRQAWLKAKCASLKCDYNKVILYMTFS